jgi:hypothetical protein
MSPQIALREHDWVTAEARFITFQIFETASLLMVTTGVIRVEVLDSDGQLFSCLTSKKTLVSDSARPSRCAWFCRSLMASRISGA